MARNIVICFDGTKNQNEDQNTNVHRLYELVDKNDSVLNYYSGVGVGSRPVADVLDQATGRGVFRTVRAAYTFVRGNYLRGDKIFIVGFSRGAFAARHLAGWIARLGVQHHTEVGYEHYRKSLLSPFPLKSFDNTHDVQFLGLFDCVPGNQYYALKQSGRVTNNSVLEPHIRNFAHCVSTAERRWSFKPLIFQETKQLRFKQKWFPGYHSDVGGEGNAPLNDYALDWMMRQASRADLRFSGNAPTTGNASGAGNCSDWYTTKFGLRFDRSQLAKSQLITQPP